MIEFEWDEQKNSSNQRKQGLSFEEAACVCVNKTDMKTVKSGGKRLAQ